MKIYESTDNRLVEINHIVDYNVSLNIKKNIDTILIITDKYYINKQNLNVISSILNNILKNININNSVPKALVNICNQIEKDFKNDKLKESILTLEIKSENNVKKYYKFIFININNILESVYIKESTSKNIKQYILTHKLKKNIFVFMEELRSLGSHIFNSMKKNNIYQCNIIDFTSKEYLQFLTLNKFFTSRDNKTINKLSFINVCLPIFEGFCLSKYSYKELKREDKYSTLKTTSRFSNNVVKIGGKTKKRVKHSINRNNTTTSHNNYYLNVVQNNKITRSKQSKTLSISSKVLLKELDTILIKVKSIYFARDIVNIPSNKSGSLSIINTVKDFIARNKLPLTVKVLEPKECLKLGMKLLYSVGQGAEPENQSRLLILEYNGSTNKYNKHNKHNKNTDGYLLVGKGITMDTGGISIKRGKHIPEMKSDVAGGASVISAMCGISRIGIKKNIVAMIPLSENTVGHKSTIPGDVLRAYNGLNVEIVDTDAEGRLVMADTLSYGCEKYPSYKIIELSTLTGEVEHMSCGKFSMAIGINYDNKEINQFVNVGEFNGERIVVMPFISGFDDELKSNIADIRNVARDCKGQLYPSTTFLSYFIGDNTKYFHIDIGGTAFTDNKKYKYDNYESSGVGVKLLIDYLML